MRRLLFWALILVAAALPARAEARVVRFVVEQRRPLAGGQAFGDVGPYERLDGTAHMEVDPRDPLNAVIVNLDKAPRNARGKVEFSAPFVILKPVDIARGNGKLFYGINNRGNSIELARFNLIAPGANAADPGNPAGVGDGFLMRLGYTIVDAGWQGDVAPGGGRLAPSLPVARRADGSSIVARIRIEYSDRTISQSGTFTLPLEGSPAFRAYEAADRDTAHSTLVVRDGVTGDRTPIRPDRWAFGRCPTGRESLVSTAFDICVFDGMRADKLYELIYPAKDPIVMGLGHAVTRDIGSFLRYEPRDAAGSSNPLASASGRLDVRRAYATGSSQTGIYLRDLIYLGFNEDESHRKIFDAVNINIAGTLRNFINVEFADPNVYSAQMDRHDFLMTSYPPLTYAVTTDPISGVRAGILQRPATDPLVIDTHTETEYYQLRASLNLVDGRGQPVPLPDTVRMYLLSNLQHGSGRVGGPLEGPRGMCEYPTNGVPAAGAARALLVAMDAWADHGTAPPPSRVPDVRTRNLVPLSEARAAFPSIPGIGFSPSINELELLNFGPHFGPSGGRLTLLPPLAGPRYMVLVPKSDADGLNLAGVRVVETAVPLGTPTGWNIRGEGFRPGNTCGLSGAYFPFAKTRIEREATGDPRRSIQERYTDHSGYVRAVEEATRTLVKERFLLPEDAERYVRDAQASDVLR
ncbi:MAG TPA: alpha/beta hydrolase domain-containing protein [Vicinamibacterales bacterium]|nr:alpha/beta hydrolase domain-containing protein [Vicinamibacterales bacterium]